MFLGSLVSYATTWIKYCIADWKYFLNTAGSELPLVSIDEMSKRINGSVIESFLLPSYNQFRIEISYSLIRLVKVPPSKLLHG